MPIGGIMMSDGKAGSVPPSDKKIPEPLVQPFDGGLAFKNRCGIVLYALALQTSTCAEVPTDGVAQCGMPAVQ